MNAGQRKIFSLVLNRWRDTPYSENNLKPGVGANCLGFVCNVLDHMHDYDPENLPPLPRLPPQTAIHQPEKAREVVRFVCKRYPNKLIWKPTSKTRPEDVQIQPMDVVVIQRSEDHPEHILIAGLRKNILWHSFNSLGQDGYGGVDITGYGWCLQRGIYRIWRPRMAL